MMTENEKAEVASSSTPLVPDDVLDELLDRVDAEGAEERVGDCLADLGVAGHHGGRVLR